MPNGNDPEREAALAEAKARMEWESAPLPGHEMPARDDEKDKEGGDRVAHKDSSEEEEC